MSDDLKKFTLSHDSKADEWVLRSDESNRAKARFQTKGDATAGGALADALGKAGGSVKIKKLDGKFQEERTFPRSKDPKTSKG